MSLLAGLALPLVCAVSQPDATYLDRIAGEPISLPRSDMAQPWPAEVLERALHLRVTADGGYAVLDPTSPLTPSLERSEESNWRRYHLYDVGQQTLMWVNRALESGARVRDDLGLSTKHVVIWADANAAWGYVAKVMYCCGKEEIRVPDIWFVARDHRSKIGLLSVSLPRDVGVNAGGDPVASQLENLFISDSKTGREDDAIGASSLYDCFFRWWDAGQRKSQHVHVKADADQPFSAVAAVVNEARRFGFGVSFLGVEMDWGGKTAKESWYDIPSAPAPATTAVPTREPGKALSGDPTKNPVTIVPVRRRDD